MQKKPSIRKRLSLNLLGLMASLAVITTLSIGWILQHEFEELMNATLEDYADLVQDILQHESINPTLPMPHPILKPSRDHDLHLVWQLIDVSNGKIISKSPRAMPVPLSIKPFSTLVISTDGEWVMVSRSLRQHANWLLIVAQGTSERHDELLEIILYPLLVLVLVGLAITALMHWRTRRELSPLEHLSEAVLKLDFNKKILTLDSANRQELEPIKSAINTLMRRLEQRNKVERTFVMHAAHALRTPIAGMQVQLSIACKQALPEQLLALESARTAAQRLALMVQALLALFRSGAVLNKRWVTLSQLLPASQWNEQLTWTIKNDSMIWVDPDLLTPVLINLADNAKQNKATEILLDFSNAAEGAYLVVQDNGTGCRANVLEQLRQRFNAAEIHHEGMVEPQGLGLVLAHTVCLAHGGKISIVAVEPGFCVQLYLPQPMSSMPNTGLTLA